MTPVQLSVILNKTEKGDNSVQILQTVRQSVPRFLVHRTFALCNTGNPIYADANYKTKQ